MKAQWQVPDNRPPVDFASTIVLKARDFATEITIHNARTHRMGNEPAITREHVTNNERGAPDPAQPRHPPGKPAT